MSAPQVPPSQRAECRALIRALPARLGGQVRRQTSAPASTAAWGDPATTVRCGVDLPEGYARASACQVIDGVGWFVPQSQVVDQSATAVLTTVDRRPRVELTVPAESRPPLEELVGVAGQVKAHTRVTHRCR